MIGMLLGFFKNFMWVGYSLVEALVLMLSWNYLAPTLILWGVPFVPVAALGYWTCVALILVIEFFGKFINKLTPKIVNISTKNESDSNSN